MRYKLGSLFDGSGGFPLAGWLCDIVPVWAAEVEPYPVAVTRSRFPGMKHYGDVTKMNGAEVEPVDIITFGSPCQDMSVAGKRAGLKHEDNGDEETTRSGLFMEAVRIIKEMRKATDGKYPTFALWENVPGAFSSNKGEDFRTVCEELIKIVEPGAVMPAVPKNGWPYADCYRGDGWSLAYRILDAQYIRTAQRRRRVYLVLHLGCECAGEVLFERDRLRRNSASCGAAWERTPADAEACVGADDRAGDCTGEESGLGGGGLPGGRGTVARADRGLNAVGCDLYNLAVSGEVAVSLTANTGTSGTHSGPTVAVPCTLEPGIAAREGGHIYEGVSGTLRANAGDNQMAVAYPVPNILLDDQGGQQVNVRTDDKCPTLRAEAHGNQPAVVFSIENHPADSRVNIDDSGKVQTLTSRMGTGGGNVPMVMESIVEARSTAGAFCPETGGNDPSRSIAFQEELSPTLRAGFTPAAVIPIHDQATRFSGKHGDKSDGKGNGLGVGEPGDPMNTLTSGDRHAVAYTMQAFGDYKECGVASGLKARDYKDATDLVVEPASFYPQMKSESQCFRQDGIANTLINGTNPGFQNGVVVPVEDNPIVLDRAFYNQGQNALYEPQFYTDGTVPTIVAKGPAAVAHGVDCRNLTESPELYPTLQAKPNGGQSLNYSGAVRVRYIVRRLTPTECARLQGFPDKWGHPDKKDSLTDEEYRFWLDVRNTHAAINGKPVKDYTREQMLTWYNKLHTDSAEYKMWGNGIALPCALYVMQGIEDVLREAESHDQN